MAAAPSARTESDGGASMTRRASRASSTASQASACRRRTTAVARWCARMCVSASCGAEPRVVAPPLHAAELRPRAEQLEFPMLPKERRPRDEIVDIDRVHPCRPMSELGGAAGRELEHPALREHRELARPEAPVGRLLVMTAGRRARAWHRWREHERRRSRAPQPIRRPFAWPPARVPGCLHQLPAAPSLPPGHLEERQPWWPTCCRKRRRMTGMNARADVSRHARRLDPGTRPGPPRRAAGRDAAAPSGRCSFRRPSPAAACLKAGGQRAFLLRVRQRLHSGPLE